MADAVYNFVREQIVSGELPSGRRLTEAWVTGETGASRTPVREALRRLTAEGYVEFASNRGARVASLGLEDTAEIFALRQLLEPFAAGAAAAAATPEDVERLRELAKEMTELVRSKPDAWSRDVAELNRDFHAAILDAGGYVRLRSMTESLVLSGLVSVTFSTYSAEELARSMNHHDELVAAIATGDSAWAEAAMTAHLRAAENVAARIIRGNDGPDDRKGES